MIATLHTSYLIAKMCKQWIQTTTSDRCVDMASIMVSWHTCYNFVRMLFTEFLWCE